MRKILAIAGLVCFFSFAQAEEQQTPTDAFRGKTQYHMLMCKISTLAELNKVQLGQSESAIPAIGKCIKDGRASAKSTYKPALAKVAKNPAATKLLKDYYAVWLTALDGVMPVPGESKGSYEQRQQVMEARYDEIWNRLEIEAGL